jgi:Ca2+-binding EF-hand superfamily protein
MIDKEDVLQVAKTINKDLTEEQIKEVLSLYESEEDEDPSATWDLIVEKIIYDIT